MLIFVVNAIYIKRKKRPSDFNQKQTYSCLMQQVLKKNQNFQQNDENIMFLAKTNGSDSV